MTAQIGYKDVDRPKNSLPLGEMLGHSVLTAAQAITTSASCKLSALHDTLLLPRVDASVSSSDQCMPEVDSDELSPVTLRFPTHVLHRIGLLVWRQSG